MQNQKHVIRRSLGKNGFDTLIAWDEEFGTVCSGWNAINNKSALTFTKNEITDAVEKANNRLDECSRKYHPKPDWMFFYSVTIAE